MTDTLLVFVEVAREIRRAGTAFFTRRRQLLDQQRRLLSTLATSPR